MKKSERNPTQTEKAIRKRFGAPFTNSHWNRRLKCAKFRREKSLFDCVDEYNFVHRSRHISVRGRRGDNCARNPTLIHLASLSAFESITILRFRAGISACNPFWVRRNNKRFSCARKRGDNCAPETFPFVPVQVLSPNKR